MPVQTFPRFYETLQNQQSVSIEDIENHVPASLGGGTDYIIVSLSLLAELSSFVVRALTPNAVLVGSWMRLLVTHTNFPSSRCSTLARMVESKRVK